MRRLWTLLLDWRRRRDSLFFRFHTNTKQKNQKNENENEKKQNEKHTNKKFCIDDRPTDQNECKKISLVEYYYYY